MKNRLLWAGLLGGLAMFAWSFIAHMVLPLGEAGIRAINNEQALLGAMKSTLPDHGLYFFPNTSADPSDYQKKLATGPSGILVYHPTRDFSFGRALVIEFGSELLQAFIAVYLLSLTRLTTFAGRLGFFAFAGLIAACATNLSYWNWYGFPGTYIAGYMFTGWMEYIFAGLVAAAMKVGGSEEPRGIGVPASAR